MTRLSKLLADQVEAGHVLATVWMITVQARDRLEAISQEKRFAKVT